MALKFLNKKGWHTGSLRNIENVWKAEQKHDAEQKKLEELRKQIQEERERSEFRLLQEQAGFIPRQERLEFLYDSGLAVGKRDSSDGFKALESFPAKADHPLPPPASSSSSSAAAQLSVPGALFEEKPHSANDAWRKLHSDPLLLIRQREQESLALIKNNPVQMAMIRKSVEAKKRKEKISGGKAPREKRHDKKSKHHNDSSTVGEEERASTQARKSSKRDEGSVKMEYVTDREQRNAQRKKTFYKDMYRKQPASDLLDSTRKDDETGDYGKSRHERYNIESRMCFESDTKRKEEGHSYKASSHGSFTGVGSLRDFHHKRPHTPSKLSAEERAAKLKEMQMDAEVHEENRWKRIKKADEIDTREATTVHTSGGRNFLDVAKRSVYGTEQRGSSSIEESVRRRTHYLQSRSEVGQGNAFRR